MSLVDLINAYFSDTAILRLASLIGEDSGGTSRALANGAVPAVMQGLLSHYASEAGDGHAGLSALLQSPAADVSLLTSVAATVGGGSHTEAVVNQGKLLVATLLGNRGDAVAELIANRCSLRRGSVTTLLSLTGPLILAALRQYQLRQASAINLLDSLSASLTMLPKSASVPGLATALGIAHLGAVVPAEAIGTGGLRAAWLIAPVALGVLGFALNSCETRLIKAHPGVAVAALADPVPAANIAAAPAVTAPAATTPVAINPAPIIPAAAPTPVAAMATAPLAPTPLAEVTAGIPKQSAVYALAQFLADPTSSAPRGFVLRDLYFTSATADIRADSRQILVDVAHVLLAYPDARVMLQGHTDNVGGADSNYALSRARASAAEATLIKLGIAPARLTTAGLGADQPLASNDTPAGRRRNRRTELLVTVK